MKKMEIEFKVGIFVTMGIVLVMIAILILGSAQNLMTRKTDYTVHFNTVEGLISGAKVVLGGLQVGIVKDITLNTEQHNIKVTISVDKKSGDWIRKDSRAEIATQGVLGDKYIAITPGTSSEAILAPGSDIEIRPSKDFSQFMHKGDQLMLTLNNLAGSLDRVIKSLETANRADTLFQGLAQSAKNLSATTEKINRELDSGSLKASLKNLASITEKINNGTGTLGALVNDAGLYDDMKSLVGGVNRNRVVRNLVRQTIKESDENQAKQKK